jgi:hypothetical protein
MTKLVWWFQGRAILTRSEDCFCSQSLIGECQGTCQGPHTDAGGPGGQQTIAAAEAMNRATRNHQHQAEENR